MNSEISELKENLFNDAISSADYPDTLHQRHLFEQYKICVEMADRISQRRNLANTLLLTLNTGVMASLAAFAEKSELDAGGLAILLVALAGLIVSCLAWRTLIRSYRQLNTAKYKVIGALESKLPASPYYSAEWAALGFGKNKALYTPLSAVESKLPTILAVAYLLIIVFVLFDQKGLIMSMFA